ncbi:MAG: DEAD/DEAH box helicase [Propionibacteriaceae bacterium]|nr:DEAD/DEAH box helicase [Propionibacteriaceae bacterium]
MTPDQPDRLAEFRSRYAFPLDDYQVTACAALAAGSGVLVAAPTGAGKTVVGEFAVHLAHAAGRKCFYTTPIKALSNQKFHDLAAAYGADQVGLLTGDQTVNGEAPIVVMTTEVLRNMIYAQSPTLAGLDSVVLDEVHYLADRFRGPVWEEVILGLDPAVRLVALSATVSNVEEFGEWLAAVRGRMETIVSERRPVPLFQHVYAGRRLYDLYERNPVILGPSPVILSEAKDPSPDKAKRPSETAPPQPPPPRVNPELLQLAKQESRALRDDSRRPRGRSGRGKRQVTFGSGQFGGAAHGRFGARSHLAPRRTDIVTSLDRAGLLPAIFFIFSRQGCDQAVRRLVADEVWLTTGTERGALFEIARQATDGLSEDDLDALRYDDWLEAFGRGLAAHHAGLLPVFKQAVEEAFSRGLVKVVFATETLALGINMPAKTVVLERLVKYNGEHHADITAGEYTQLTGRAGRRGIDVEGHAVVAWAPGLDPRAVAGLAARRTYPLRSAFNPTANMAVNLIGSLGAKRARRLLEQSFAQFHADRARGLPPASGGGSGAGPGVGSGAGRSHVLVDRFDRICGVLEALGYLERSEGGPDGAPGRLVVTPAGQMLARIYGEQDLVVAEAVRAGVFAGLTSPQLAAVFSTLVYEARAFDRRPLTRLPDRASDRALAALRRTVRDVALVERDFRLDPRPPLDIGFADAAYRWADGATLGEVLEVTGTTAGDFVRWIRQTMDLAGQIADADKTGPLAQPCRTLVQALRRGVVEVSADD